MQWVAPSERVSNRETGGQRVSCVPAFLIRICVICGTLSALRVLRVLCGEILRLFRRVGSRARTSCYGFHPVTTKTGRFSSGLTQFVEGAIATAERWQ